MDNWKEVDFENYCKKCKYFDEDEIKDPCNICLDASYNRESCKPIMWEEKK